MNFSNIHACSSRPYWICARIIDYTASPAVGYVPEAQFTTSCPCQCVCINGCVCVCVCPNLNSLILNCIQAKFFLHANKWHFAFEIWPLQLWVHQYVNMEVAVYRDLAIFCEFIQRRCLLRGELRLRTPHKSHQLSVLSVCLSLRVWYEAFLLQQVV